jgi:SAM-dependent methyltransferase
MKPNRTTAASACLAVLALFAAAHGGGVEPGVQDKGTFSWDGLQIALGVSPDVPYVSTPYEIADEMIRLAGVKAHDVVYDLGCGDGRLVIEAVKRTGCRGVGVDIDGELIAVCLSKAKEAGIADRVRFERRDFFETDIREATVMLIYLFTHVNLRLRPKFLDEMKPGSRLVSHTFDMGDWRPDRSTSVGGRKVFAWVIPANVTGTWRWSEPGMGRCALEIDQRYQQIRGTLRSGTVKTGLAEASLSGDRIAFAIEEGAGGTKVRREFAGTLRGDAITGTMVSRQGAGVQSSRWRAFRDPSTRRPVETGYQNSDLIWY